MIDPLLPNAIKTRLLENIQEIINSNGEKFLDISIVCQDGSFMWSQFLLAAASDLFAAAMQGVEVTQVIFPDCQVKDVRGSLLGLLYNTPPKETEHVFSLNKFVEFLKKSNSPGQDSNDINFCIDTELVKSEIDEIIQGEDLDLNWSKPINNIDINFLQLEPLEQSTGKQNNIKVEDDDWDMGDGEFSLTLQNLKHNIGPHMLELDQSNNASSSRSILKVNQTDIKIHESTKTKMCGTCDGCVNRSTTPDCDACTYCLDKRRNGGPNKLKKACINRLCVLVLNERGKRFCQEKQILAKQAKEKQILLKEGLEGTQYCNYCEYTCTNLRSLREHKKKKHAGEYLDIPQVGEGDLKFSCDFCSDYFRTRDDVLNHVKIDHKDYLQTYKNNHTNDSYSCNMCEYMCTNLSILKEHKKTSHQGEFLDIPLVDDVNGDMKFKCDFCEQTSGKKGNIIDHVRVQHKHEFKSWIETVKKKKVKGEHIQIGQIQIGQTVRRNRCNMCEFMCTHVSLLKEHKETCHPGEFLDIPRVEDVNGDRKFKCVFCEKSCGKKCDLIDHVRLHHKNDFKSWIETVKKKTVKGEYIQNTRSTGEQIQSSRSRTTGKLLKHFYKKDGTLFKCNLCDENFHALLDFREHVSTVHKDKYGKELDFICDVCGDGFLRRSALNHHVLIHLPSVTCPQCDKVFTTTMSLKKHQKFSCKSEVALKFCELCGKGFKTNWDLKVHNNRIHLNHRPFKCTICGNTFKTMVHFKTHCTGKHNIENENYKQYLLKVNPESEKIAD